LYLTLLRVLGSTIKLPVCADAKVYPSGFDLTKLAIPIDPLPPMTFSTIIGCPKISVSLGEIIRVVKSIESPGGNGMMILIGLFGQAWANELGARTVWKQQRILRKAV
jgi:hypothetical protein